MRHICRPVLASLRLERSTDITLIGAVVDSLEFVCFVFHDVIISEGQLDVPGLFVIGEGTCRSSRARTAVAARAAAARAAGSRSA